MDYGNNTNADNNKSSNNDDDYPAKTIEKIIIGKKINDECFELETKSLFSELLVLRSVGDDFVWEERARWIKYEELVEEGGNRWSKPHVATISLHSLFELRSCLLNGVVILNSYAKSFEQIADAFVSALILKQTVTKQTGEYVKEILLKRHHHQFQKGYNRSKSVMRSLVDLRQNSSLSLAKSENNTLNIDIPNTIFRAASAVSLRPDNITSLNKLDKAQQFSQPNSLANSRVDLVFKFNHAFMRKIPSGTETNNILVAEVDFLDTMISGFIRLSEPSEMGDLSEVPVATRFVFIIMGPHRYNDRYYRIGRAYAALMSDQVFSLVAFKAQNKDILLSGIDEFLDAVTVLPPGVWDPTIRIEPPERVPTQESRKLQSHYSNEPEKSNIDDLDSIKEEELEREKSGLKRTNRLFGGLINDVKRKAPWYWSDIKDGFALQSIASVTFLYFACLSPIITFGGLLGDATGNNIATMESLMCGAICGVVYGLFSGQPLTIIGSTGPVLVFETILYDFCLNHGLNYLSFRMWIGLWTAAIMMILVALDASAFVCFITRFTEENFATLISVIFIYKAIEKLLLINTYYPLNMNPDEPLDYNCSCLYPNNTQRLLQTIRPNSTAKEHCLDVNGTLVGSGCETPIYINDVFLLSVILLFATYFISVTLKEFRTKPYLPSKYRHVLSDFSVPIAIVLVTAFDKYMSIDTPKLIVPTDFKPTSPNRGWLIPPFVPENPMWLSVAAVVPAILVTILCFMDQQITAVIVNRKENKLKKGCGYHLDLFLIAILIAICSTFGLPWFVAATVLSMTHVNSLKMESETSAPGEKPQFLGVREQRVTSVIIFVLCGLSIFLTSFLQIIPMPVLYGVFLYMGTTSLQGSQFIERILIIFMPQKYQPDYAFLRQVRTRRVHLFTLIQILCFALLWIIKSYKPSSITFPLMLVIMIIIRKLLDRVFTRHELKVLDDIMPESTKRKRNELKEKFNGNDQNNGNEKIKPIDKLLEIPLANGDILKIDPQTDKKINISEQLSKSSAWKSINEQNVCNGSKNKVYINEAKNSDETIALNELNGTYNYNNNNNNDINKICKEESDCGITIRIN